MPIKMWWWVKPLLETGVVTLFLFGIPACFISGSKAKETIANILSFLAISPLLTTLVSVIVWLVVNVFVIIWS